MINRAWHAEHRMPTNPTLEQRIEWHREHARECGCRPMPASIATEIARREKAEPTQEPSER